MIHARQMQKSVQDQNAQLIFNFVAAFGGLGSCTIEGDGDIFRWKRQDIRRVIFPSKFSIQRPKLFVGSDQTCHAL